MAGFNKKPINYVNPEDIEIYGRLKFNSDTFLDKSENIETFPYDKLVANNPFEANPIFALRVDKASTCDNPDGSTWSKAFKEIQDALDYLPHDLNGYTAYIFIHGGDYEPVLVSKQNGYISMEWVGTFVNDGTDDWNTFIRAGETDPIRNNDRISIVTRDEHNGVSAFRGYYQNLTLRLRSQNPAIPWNQPESWYWGRWYFSTVATSHKPYTVVDMNPLNGDGAVVIDTGIKIDMGTAGNWWGIGLGIGANQPSSVRGAEIIGGSGDASSQSSFWAAAVAIVRENTNVDLFSNVGAQWATGYEPPDNKLAYFADVKNVFSDWYRHPSLKKVTLRLNKNDTKYVDINESYGKGRIGINHDFSGRVEYSPTYYDLIDGSSDSRTLVNTDTGETTVYISGAAGVIGGDLEVDGSLKFNSDTKIDKSENVQVFPYDLLVTDPDGNKAFRFMVDPNGDDNNDGLSWDTPKKTIQAVIDSLPNNLLGYTVHIYVKPGTYPSFEIRNYLHGKFHLDWFGTPWLDTDSDWKEFARGGSSTVTTTDDPIIIEAASSEPAVAFQWNSDDTHFEIWSRNIALAGHEPGFGYWGRWVLTTAGDSPYIYLQDRGESFILNLLFDLKAGRNFGYYVGSGIGNLYSAEFVGGTGNASIKTGTWYGAIAIYSSEIVKIGSYGGGFKFHQDYPNPDGATIVYKDIKGGYTSAVFDNKNTRYEPQKMVYYDVNQTYGKTNLYLGSLFSGYIKYNEDYATVQDTSAYPRVIYETKTDTMKNYIASGESTIDGTAIVDDIKIVGSDTLPTCNADSKGKLYFNTSDNHFYGCDGTNWKQLDN